MRPQDPPKVAAALRPDYGLGSHVATLGLAFSTPAMGSRFADGLFVGEHGSRNRDPPSGYRVVFVPFRDGRPAGDPVDVVTGFFGDDGKTRGRPVGVTVDPRGALLVADDLSNTLWRVAPADRPAGEGGGTGATAAPDAASRVSGDAGESGALSASGGPDTTGGHGTDGTTGTPGKPGEAAGPDTGGVAPGATGASGAAPAR